MKNFHHFNIICNLGTARVNIMLEPRENIFREIQSYLCVHRQVWCDNIFNNGKTRFDLLSSTPNLNGKFDKRLILGFKTTWFCAFLMTIGTRFNIIISKTTIRIIFKLAIERKKTRRVVFFPFWLNSRIWNWPWIAPHLLT